MYAASSLSGGIALYDETSGEDPIAYLDGIGNGSSSGAQARQAIMQVRSLIPVSLVLAYSQ